MFLECSCLVFAFAADDEAAVRHVVQAFYMAFDEGFVKPVDFATDDWYHINPFGGIDRGLAATLKTVREVHTTFLKGVTDTPEVILFALRPAMWRWLRLPAL